jgi:hypothetical protein
MMNQDDMPLVELLELQELLDILNEGELTQEQGARLQDIVVKYASARQYYLQAMFFFGQLRWQAAHQEKEEEQSTPSAPTSILGFLGESYRNGCEFFLRDIPFALFLIFIFVGLSLFGSYWLINTLDRPLEYASNKPNFVAQITATRDCQGSTIIPPPTEMMQLQAGQQLQLEKGVAQITYSNGAVVLLEGPASFTVDSATSGFLSHGKLTARADIERSRQFTIATPQARFVDLGTEFGVMIDDKGRSSVAVFAGKVVAEAKMADGRWTTLVSLRKGESVVCEGTKYTSQVAQRSNFPSLQPLSPNQQISSYQRWLDAAKEMRNHKDMLAYYDFQPDKNNPNVLLNRSTTGAALNGEIQNATWVDGRFPGKKALEFLAANAGVIVNLPGEYQQMTVIAWVNNNRLANKYNGILMSNDWAEQKKLHFQIQNNRQINMHVFGQLVMQEAGQNSYCSTEAIPADIINHWCMIAGVIDTPNHSSLYLNGDFFETLQTKQIPPIQIGSAMIGGWNKENSPDPDVIRSFSGRIDELLIFQKALTAAEIKQIYQRGKP